MTNEDIKFLKNRAIKDSRCDMGTDLVFLSYAHDNMDTEIVYEVFRKLYARGYNVWIDAANMPHDENSWKTFADEALTGGHCKVLILFRSESSLSKRTIKDEVETFKMMDGSEHNTIAVDIYHEEGTHTRHLRKRDDFKEGTEARENFEAICKVVDQSCNAIRYNEDCEKNIDILVGQLSVALQDKGISPRFSLQDKIVEIMEGSFDVSLQGDQCDALYMYKRMLSDSEKDGKKRVLVVRGDPGTGKSVLSMKMMMEARNRNAKVALVSKNAAPREAYLSVLTKAYKTAKNKDKKSRFKEYLDEASDIFRGSARFVEYDENSFDVIIVDESHRLEERQQYIKKVEGREYSQIGDMIKAGRVVVFFYDPRQIVSNADIGSVEEIVKWSNIYKVVRPEGIHLRTQCRCNGSNDYIDWLDSTLGYEDDMGLFITKRSEYDLRVYDSPYEMYQEIKRLNDMGDTSRLLSGYCWKWENKADARNNANKHDIEIPDDKAPHGKFGISWNLEKADSYAKRADSIKESGSIHTVQGVEFQYVGVIIGPDMIYEGDEIVTRPLERASTDNTLNGLIGDIKEAYKNRKKDPGYKKSKAEKKADEIIRNTYRILMTRGKLGCFIYCTDPALREYMHKKVREFHGGDLNNLND